ncbi:MAG TPA: YggU family protein [Deltaproteobacteria bacterium]|nr:MAG: YggU family protein [Deltaproteobacteria bacterium]HDM76431.1 YggU family protein [Deltaproteobacteria bacterium]
MSRNNQNSNQVLSRTQSGTILLQVLVQPRASRDEVVGVHGNHLKIRLTSPPVEGAANKNLVRLLSKKLKVPAGKINIRKGLRGRQKLVEIEDCDLDHVRSRLGV